MTGSTFGRLLRLTTFGESHGPAVGGILDGVPAGIKLNLEQVQQELWRRRPGQAGKLASARKEEDRLEILSGVLKGVTLGTPIGFVVRNVDPRSEDYEALREVYRPGHADYVYEAKFGFRDWRGGGRASARETVARVAGGAIARQLVAELSGARVFGWVCRLGELAFGPPERPEVVWDNQLRIPEPGRLEEARGYLLSIREKGEGIGSQVEVVAEGVPAGLGEPVFDKLDALIAQALFSIPAVKAVEVGSGTRAATMRSSEHNDQPDPDGVVRKNQAGGIVGGISDARPIRVRVTFKPPSSIPLPQRALTRKGEVREVRVTGRHDPVIAPRALPVVEAMLCLVLADQLLIQRSRRRWDGQD